MKIPKPDKSAWRLILIISIGVLLIAGATILLMPWFIKLQNPEYQQEFKRLVSSAGVVGWFIILGIQMLQIIIAFIPGGPVEIISGIIYGTLGGTALCLVGSLAASAIIFSVVRAFGLPLLYKLFGKEKIDNFSFLKDSKRIETIAFILFLIPGMPKDMLTYIAGVSPIKMSRFLLITTFARLPATLTSAMVGATMRDGNWILSLIIFSVTAVIGIIGIIYKNKIIDYFRQAGAFIKNRKNKKTDN